MNQKGFAPIIILLAVLFIAGLGGAYYFGTYVNKPLQPQPTIQPLVSSPTQQLTVPVTTAKIDETANWKTYTSQKNSFSLKYPSGMEIEEKSDNYTAFILAGPTQKKQTELYDGIGLFIIKGTLQGRSLKNFVEAEAKQAGEMVKPITTTYISSYEAYTYTSRGLGEHTYIYIANNGTYWEIINSTGDPTHKGFQKTVDQILSTFRFIE